MKNIKKIFTLYWSVTAVIYIIVFLIVSFVEFRFYNPFMWIIKIPSYSNQDRFFILFGYSMYCLMVLPLCHEYVTKDKPKNP